MPYRPISKYEQERKKQNAREYELRRKTEHDFYNSSQWHKMRAYMRSKYPLCAECLKNGIVRAGELVDHIVPIEAGGAKLDEKNLQVLCSACHNKKHGAERVQDRGV